MIPSLCEIIGRATLLQRQTIAVTLTGDFFYKSRLQCILFVYKMNICYY